jgi:hypothetical protein
LNRAKTPIKKIVMKEGAVRKNRDNSVPHYPGSFELDPYNSENQKEERIS